MRYHRGSILIVVIAMLITPFSTIAHAACTGIKCKCAVQFGGTYNPRTDRWAMHGCSPAQVAAFDDCVARGLGKEVKNQKQSEKPKLLRVDPENRFGNAAIRRKLQPVALGAPHFDPGPVSVNKKDKNAKESQGLAPIDMNTVIPGSAPRGP